MEKQKIIDFLKTKVEEYVSTGDFDCAGDDYDAILEEEWEFEDKTLYVVLRLDGYNEYYEGNRDSAPFSTGWVSAEVLEVRVVDDDSEITYDDIDVKSRISY